MNNGNPPSTELHLESYRDVLSEYDRSVKLKDDSLKQKVIDTLQEKWRTHYEPEISIKAQNMRATGFGAVVVGFFSFEYLVVGVSSLIETHSIAPQDVLLSALFLSSIGVAVYAKKHLKDIARVKRLYYRNRDNK